MNISKEELERIIEYQIPMVTTRNETVHLSLKGVDRLAFPYLGTNLASYDTNLEALTSPHDNIVGYCDKNKHPHYDNMVEYTKDALTSSTPWENWEFSGSHDWSDLRSPPIWDVSTEYRRKQFIVVEMGTINGLSRPIPLDVMPNIGTRLYFVMENMTKSKLTVTTALWNGSNDNLLAYYGGFVFSSKASAEKTIEIILSTSSK